MSDPVIPGNDPAPPIPPLGDPPIKEPPPKRLPDEEPLPNPDENPEQPKRLIKDWAK